MNDLPEHIDLSEKFKVIEKKFFDIIRKRVNSGEMKIGVAHTLMAGVYAENTDKRLVDCGFNNRDSRT